MPSRSRSGRSLVVEVDALVAGADRAAGFVAGLYPGVAVGVAADDDAGGAGAGAGGPDVGSYLVGAGGLFMHRGLRSDGYTSHVVTSEPVSSRELRLSLADYLDRARAGESFTITRNGRPAAVLSPPIEVRSNNRHGRVEEKGP
jgi:prevent-host-death family protein